MNPKTKLSRKFTYGELTKSNSEICKRLGIKNEPNEQELQNLKDLAVNVLDPCSDFVGKLGVTSGFRCKAYNSAIPNADPNSQHIKGQASDLDCDIYGKGTNGELFHYIKDNLEFDVLIWEFGDDANPAWVHVSYNKNQNRKIVKKAIKFKGAVKYIPF